jgi:two-component system nitrogen regulation response regulator GlnG
VRELQSTLKQALLHAQGTTLLPAFLPALSGEPSEPATAAGDPNLDAYIRQCLASGGDDLYAEAHRQVDRLLLARVLEDTGGNQIQAARRLGIGRGTLRRRLLELGLRVSRQLEAEDDDQP